MPPDARATLGRSENEFHGNDFSRMSLRDSDFRTGIDLTQQILPDGDEYLLLRDARQAVVRARAEVSRWEDDGARQGALGLLRVLMEDVAGGQEQLLLRRKDLASSEDQQLLELLGLREA